MLLDIILHKIISFFFLWITMVFTIMSYRFKIYMRNVIHNHIVFWLSMRARSTRDISSYKFIISTFRSFIKHANIYLAQ